MVDQVRRRVRQETLRHRGRKHDPLFRIRRAVYLVDDPEAAGILLDNAVEACRADPVPEIATMGRTLPRGREEILNHHRTGASNGPTEGMDFCAKRQAGRSITDQLRSLQFASTPLRRWGVSWPAQIWPPRIPSTSPHSVRKSPKKLTPPSVTPVGEGTTVARGDPVRKGVAWPVLRYVSDNARRSVGPSPTLDSCIPNPIEKARAPRARTPAGLLRATVVHRQAARTRS